MNHYEGSHLHTKTYTKQKMSEIIQVNVPFFLFWRNLKNKAARAKKRVFLAIFRKRGKNDGFLALAALFLRFRRNKKKMEQ